MFIKRYQIITMHCGGDKIWHHCKSETKFMDYFTNTETFSVQWFFVYAGNKLYLHKKKRIISDY